MSMQSILIMDNKLKEKVSGKGLFQVSPGPVKRTETRQG